MKICIVSDFFFPHYNGGGERRYYEIAKRLVSMGNQVDVICMKIEGVDNVEDIDGIHVHHIGPNIKKPPQRNSSDFIKYIFAVFKWIITHNYDLIDAQTYAPLIPAFFSAKLKRTPIIGTIHDVSTGGSDQWIQSSKIASILEKILVRIPYNKIITVSNETKKSLVNYYGVKSDRIKVIYNGVDIELIDSVTVNKKYENSLVFVGRLAPHKHVDDLIGIVKIIKDYIPNIQLRIIGSGNELKNLIQLVKDNNLQDNVEFRVNVSYEELISEVKKSNILILPSTREGFGIVLAEANACRVPVVAYSSGGVVEVVNNGENGFLVPPNDTKSLEDKIKLLLENQVMATNMGLNGRKRVEENFNWDIIVPQIVAFYESLIFD